MTTWKVELIGRQSDLEDLYNKFQSGVPGVRKADGRYFLISDDFNDCKDDNEVQNRADFLASRMNGAMQITTKTYQPIRTRELIEIDDTGKERSHFIPKLQGIVYARSSTKARLTILGKEDVSQEPSLVPDEQAWIKVADKVRNVDKLLIISEDGLSWPTLYKVWEIIEEDKHGKAFTEYGVDSREIKLFKKTANSFIAIGKDARHARVDRYKQPINPMSLREARSLIRTVATKWLNEKAAK